MSWKSSSHTLRVLRSAQDDERHSCRASRMRFISYNPTTISAQATSAQRRIDRVKSGDECGMIEFVRMTERVDLFV